MEQQLHERRQRLNRLQQDQDQQELEDLLPSLPPSPPSSSSINSATRPRQPRQPAAPRRTVSTLPGEKTCWICYETSLESPDRPFIHACSCTLLSHPDCLLEWISTRTATNTSTSTPRCPVCATLIIVKEDKSNWLVHYRDFRRKLDKLSMAASVAGVAGSAWLVASAYGLWAVRVFMGDQVTRALLERNQKGIPFRLWRTSFVPFDSRWQHLTDTLYLHSQLAIDPIRPHSLSHSSNRFPSPFPSFNTRAVLSRPSFSLSPLSRSTRSRRSNSPLPPFPNPHHLPPPLAPNPLLSSASRSLPSSSRQAKEVQRISRDDGGSSEG